MKHQNKALILLLCAMFATYPIVGCASGESGEVTEETAVITDETRALLAGFTLVRPDIAEKLLIDSAVKLNNELNLTITTDFVKRGADVPETNVELLVGETNRAASKDALAVLTDFRGNVAADYIIRVAADKIVIVGGSDEATVAGVEHFISEIAPRLDAEKLASGFEEVYRREYKLETLAGRSAGDFTILIPDNDLYRETASALQSRLTELTGFILPISTKKVETPAVISLGAVGTSAHEAALKELTDFRKNCYSDWLVRANDKGIVAAGVSEVGNAAALDYFLTSVCPELESGKNNIEFINRKDYDMITLNKKSIGDYTITLPKNASIDLVNAAESIKARVLEQTGFELKISRGEASPAIRIELGDGKLTDAKIAFDGDDLVISGAHYYPVAQAAKQLIALFDGDVELAADYALSTVCDKIPLVSERYPEMTLVWNDEFDYEGEGLYDSSKWLQRAQMSATDMYNSKTERNVKTEDGTLILRSWKEDETDPAIGKPYSTNMSMTTRDSCNYYYGYLEMRAKVPFGKGCWPSFWMVQREDMRGGENWMAEIDIFEVFGSKDRLVPNIHKWYDTINGERYHVQLGGDRKQPYIFEDIENLSDEYHTYGFYWDETKMIFSVDGIDYCEFDITAESGDFGKYKGMEGFHSPSYIILNNFLFTPEASWIPDGAMVDDNLEYPVTYTIDYMRLWQGENGVMRAPNLEALEAEDTAK